MVETVTFEPNYSSEKLRVGLKVLANVLKAAINADLSANTGALLWQGAMTHSRGWVREENTYRWRAGSASLVRARYGERSIPRGPSDAFPKNFFLS